MPYQPAVLGTARLNNFRLGYLTAAQTSIIKIILGGVDISQPGAVPRVIYKSMTIQDVVFDAPNTCRLTLLGGAPTVGQRLEIWMQPNDPILLFGGELQTVERTYKGRPSTVLHPCTAIDDTAAANRKRPLGLFTQTSATTVAQWLISTYAPGFSSAGVEANLPPVTVTFDGSEAGMKGCLTQIAKLIGGYWYFENKTLYFFVTPPGTSPDPITDAPKRFAHDPAITWAMEKSQVRTRVYGKGASTTIATTIAAGTDLVPVREATMFNPTGGKAIAGVSPDGAACIPLTYTGVQLGGGGGLVGPGASPSSAPALVLVDGTGIESGAHSYAVTFVTAAGESLPGPAATITVGATAAPATAPTAGVPTAGGAIDPGYQGYYVTFVTASGETTASPASNTVTTESNVGGRTVPAPAATPSNQAENGNFTPGWNVGDVISYRVTFYTATGETTGSPFSPGVAGTRPEPFDPDYLKACRVGLQLSTDPAVIGRRLYRYKNGVIVGYKQIADNTSTLFIDYSNISVPGITPPATNTATVAGTNLQTVALTGIPTGPANVTSRKLYRFSPSYGWRLVTTLANNTATTHTDTAASSTLTVAPPPATNTAAANRVQMTLALGGASVIGRKIYRSAANLTALQYLGIFNDNTTTGFLDAFSDAVLGAAAPVSDTSGLTQPSGQVPPGGTVIIVANTAPFATAGGWAVVGNGEQVIRYTGKTATSLTGIPATGPGALVAAVSYNSTITAAPTLSGVAGIVVSVLQGAPIHVWVQRDDIAAQAYMAALDGGGDGVYEHIVSDDRRSEASLIQICDAELALYSRPLVTVTYATRDLKTKSGKTVAITLTSPAINESLTIQDVAISEIGIAGLAPKYTVTASTVHHTFEAILQKLIRNAGS